MAGDGFLRNPMAHPEGGNPQAISAIVVIIDQKPASYQSFIVSWRLFEPTQHKFSPSNEGTYNNSYVQYR